MKISKSTVIRSLALLLTVINIIIRRLGFDPFNIDDSELASAVELLIEIAAIISSWWYNNSFSKTALKAQEFLKDLREEGHNV